MYAHSLNFAMNHKWIVILATVVIVVMSAMSLRFINQAFIPTLDQGQFDVVMELSPGTPLVVTQREANKVEIDYRQPPRCRQYFHDHRRGRLAQCCFVLRAIGGRR